LSTQRQVLRLTVRCEYTNNIYQYSSVVTHLNIEDFCIRINARLCQDRVERHDLTRRHGLLDLALVEAGLGLALAGACKGKRQGQGRSNGG